MPGRAASRPGSGRTLRRRPGEKLDHSVLAGARQPRDAARGHALDYHADDLNAGCGRERVHTEIYKLTPSQSQLYIVAATNRNGLSGYGLSDPCSFRG